MRRETLACVARPLGQTIDPHMPLEAPLQCRGEIGLVARDVHGARDPNLHRVEGAALRLDVRLELRDETDDVLGQIGQAIELGERVACLPPRVPFRILVGAPIPHPTTTFT